MLVVYDLDDDIFPVLDRGRTRNSSDVLSQIGAKNCTNLAAGIIKWNTLKKGNYTENIGGNDTYRLTPQDVLSIYLSDKESFDDSTQHASYYYSKFRGLKESEYFAIYHLLKKNYKEKIQQFFIDLSTGASLCETNPAFLLRSYLINSMSGNSRLINSIKYAYIIKAWNYYVVGRDLKKLMFSPKTESMPEFI
jgi:hypothetical protein